MHREHAQWWSPRLGRTMDLLVFGHAGTPVLVFPSSLGRFYEWEDFGMVGALAEQLEHGHNQLVCVDSVDAESLYNKHVDPYTRIKRHQQYEGYIMEEVVPFIRHRAPSDFLITAGASFGAYHAANVAFRHPHVFGKLVALSGAFDVRRFFNGFYNDDVYFNNPVDYVPGLDDDAVLNALRRNHLIFTLGEFDPCRSAIEQMSGILHRKGIPHHVDFLRGAFGHDWSWWRDLVRRHIA